MIIEQGDLSLTLFVIAAGRVRAHDGERTIVELSAGDVFGDLEALAPAPRVASVTALDQTSLLWLQHDTLFELMESEIDISRGIFSHLCRRLSKGA